MGQCFMCQGYPKMSNRSNKMSSETGKKTNYYVKKNNEVTKALFYDMSLTAYRILLLAGSDKFVSQLANPANTKGRIRLNAADYHEVFGKPGAHASPSYRAIKKSVPELLAAKLRFKNFKNDTDAGRWNGGVNWVSYAAYNDTLKVLELSFSPDILPYLYQVKSSYTYYSLRNIAELSSIHTVRMYELMMFWRKKGRTPVVSVPQLKAWLGIPDDEYQDLAKFTYKVVKKSIKEINDKQTDISLGLYTEKQGNVTTGFSISILKDVEPTDAAETATTEDRDTEDDDGTPELPF